MIPKGNAKPLFMFWLLTSAVLLVALGIQPLRLTLSSPKALSSVVDDFYDDAYYYLGIATNLAETGRSTLDGRTLTNGYHPLWLFVLALLAKISGSSPWRLFYATHWLIGLTASVPSVLALRWRGRKSESVAIAAATGLSTIVLQYPVIFLMGMEPLLLLPLFVPLLVLLESPFDRRSLLRLSAVLALAFLVRIDALALYGAVIVVCACEALWSGKLHANVLPIRWSFVFRISAFVLPTVVAYLLINAYVFHSPVPVSGVVKSLDGPRGANWGVMRSFLGQSSQSRALLFLSGLWVFLEIVAWRMALRSTVFWRSIATFCLMSLVAAVYYAVFSTWPIWQWYTYPTAFLCAAMAARVVCICSLLLKENSSNRRIALPALATLLAMEIYSAYLDNRDAMRALLKHRQPITAPTDESSLSFNQVSVDMLQNFFREGQAVQVAMGDRAGALAYWGHPRLSVVQAEGLTLDAPYIAARRNMQAEQYFVSSFDIRYWIVDREFIPVVASSDGSEQYVVVEPIQGRVAIFRVPAFCFPESALVYRRTYGQAIDVTTRFVFMFSERRICSREAQAFIEQVQHGQGFRQLSHPAKYWDTGVSGLTPNIRKIVEDRDRRIALRLSQ